jgi:hypothetical protein
MNNYVDDWIITDDGNRVSFIKIGYELDRFEITPINEMYYVKVPIRQADCIYTTRFSNLVDARQFIEYHLQTYCDSI